MYEELVKRLRDAAKMSEALAVLLPHSEGNATAKLYNEAADAIEELSKRVDESIPKDDAEIIIAEVAKPRWISVTERLPETSGVYLVWMQWDLTDPDDKPSAYPIEYDAEEESFGWWSQHFDPESLGWAGNVFIRYVGVTHWMPLPQPPKEE